MRKVKHGFKKYVNILFGRKKPSRRLVRGTQGSVSIFLLVIMLPMLVFSFSVMDICKIFLAENVVAGADDIALRSAMTTYDDILKDMYGIFATSKNDEELTNKVAEYYKATLSSYGLSASDNGETADFIKSIFGTDIDESAFSNNEHLLKVFPGGTVNGTTLPAVKISGVMESAASNPSVLRREIVEYMKYRGPVSLAAGLFEKIGAFKDLPNQTKAATKKLNFEREASKLNNNVVETYALLRVYDYNNKKLTGVDANLTGVSTDDSIKKNALDKYKYDGGAHKYGSVKNEIQGAADILCRDAAYLDSIAYYIPVFADGKTLTAKKNIKISETDDFTFEMTGAYDDIKSKYSDIFGYINDEKTGEYIDELKKLCADGSKLSEEEKKKAEHGLDILNRFTGLYDGTEKSTETADTDFAELALKFISYYEGITDNGGAVSDDSHTDFYNNLISARETAAKKAKDIYDAAESDYNTASNSLNSMYDAFSKQSDIISILLGEKPYCYKYKNGEAVPAYIGLDEIIKVFNSTKEAAGCYEESLKGIKTETQKNSFTAQYNDEAADFKEMEISDCESMKNYLAKQKEIFDSAKNAIASIEFLKGGHIIKAGSEGSEKQHKTYAKFGDYLKEYTKDSFEGKRSFATICSAIQTEGNIVKYETKYSTPSGYSEWTEFFEKVTDNDENPFYKKIKELATPKSDESKDGGKDIQKEINERGKVEENGKPADKSGSSEKGSEDKDKDDKEDKDKSPCDIDKFSKYYEEHPELHSDSAENASDEKNDGQAKQTSEFSAGGISGENDDMADGAMNLLDSVGAFFEQLAGTLGESVYITEYFSKQFSCATTGRDGSSTVKYDATMLSGYKFCDGKTPKVVWYGAEQEYILYGADSPEKNVAIAGAAIFGIRFVLNLIYSFTDAEIRSFTLSAATAMGGIFPLSVPLIQTALHIGLSLAESAWDLNELMNGAEVPIYKTSTTWVCKGTNIVREIGAKVVETVGAKVIDTVADNLCNYINDKENDISNLSKEKLDELEKVVNEEIKTLQSQVKSDIIMPIQSAIQKCITGIGRSGAITKDEIAKAMRDACATMRATLNLPKEGAAIADDNYLKLAESAALTELEKNIDNYARELYDNLDSYIDAATGINLGQFAEGSNVGEQYLGEFSKKIDELLNDVVKKITDTIGGFKDSISKKLNEALDALANKAKEGVNIGKEAIKDQLGKFSNQIRGQGHIDMEINYKEAKESSTSSVIGMSYQDYLQVFMIISVLASGDDLLERSAQLISANVAKESGNKDYDLNKARTLLRVDGTATVRTVFLGSVYQNGKLTMANANGKYSFTHTTYLGY